MEPTREPRTQELVDVSTPRGAARSGVRSIPNRLAGWLGIVMTLALLGACSTTDVGIGDFDSASISIVGTSVQGSAVDQGGRELDGSVVSGTVTIAVDANPTPDRVVLYVDDAERAGAPFATDASSPYQFELDTTTLPNGEHVLAAVIESTRGKRVHSSVESATFTVSNSTSEEPAPGDGSGGEPPVEPSVTSVQIAEGDVSIEQGKSVALTAIVETTGDADATVTWSSSNDTVAVDANGVVTALAEGAALVTATSVFDASKSATVSVTVWVPQPTEPTPSTGLELRGDPNFSESQLSSEGRMWYRRMWLAIEHPDQDPDATGKADTGNTYYYGRTLNEYMTSLFVAFRATGDLKILDEVDRLAQMMRGHLRTTFVTVDGNVSTPDDPAHPNAYDPTDGTQGLRRWLQLRSADYYGTDTHDMDDILTHSMVAAFAYAFHNNRDLASPSGVDYGERADFWLDYLQNDFERKWRIRNSVPTAFPFMEKRIVHPYTHFVRYHHYMYEMTGDTAYQAEAERMIGKIMEDQVQCSTPLGTGYVWTHSLQSLSSKDNWQQPTMYVAYDVTARYDLAFEGMSASMDSDHMQSLVNSLATFVDDGDPLGSGNPFAGAIGGQLQERCGVPYRDWDHKTQRRTYHDARAWAPLIYWDSTGEMKDILDRAFDWIEWDIDNPRRVEIPIAQLLMSSPDLLASRR